MDEDKEFYEAVGQMKVFKALLISQIGQDNFNMKLNEYKEALVNRQCELMSENPELNIGIMETSVVAMDTIDAEEKADDDQKELMKAFVAMAAYEIAFGEL